MRERYALLLLLLCLLAALKWEFNPGLGRNSLDGDFYFQIARHVAEGDGLQTSVSLYHQGFKELPHDTNIYPVWPLVLGWSGRAAGMWPAATLLPELLYLVDLVLLYLLANRLVRRLRGGSLLVADGSVLDAGHAAVLLLGLNHVFFNFTSLPYTEALAFAFLFAALLALDRAGEGPWPWAAAAGGLATLAFMTRSQFLGLILAVVATLGAVELARRRFPRKAAIAAGVTALCLLPWVLHLVGFVKPFNPRAMLTIGVYRETPEIEPFQWTVETGSFGGMLMDRLSGVVTAMDPTSRFSYVESFGLAAWLVPLGLLTLVIRRRDWVAAARSAVEPARAVVTGAVVTGVLLLGPLQVLHSRYLGSWRFAHRHGLPLILLMLVALAYLLSRDRRVLRWVALALVAISIVSGAFRTVHLLNVRYPAGLLGPEPELVEWLDAQTPRPTVLTTNVHTLAVYSRSGFHWMECRESGEKTVKILDLLPIDYVILYAGEERCPFSAGLADLELVKSLGEGSRRIEVFGRSVSEPSAGLR